MEGKKVTIETIIQADRSKVWEYFTDPQHITKWNFASDDWQCPSAQNDLQVGGKYVARMEAKDGSFGFDFEAIYDEVIDQEKITYTMGDGRKATTDFFEQDGSTHVRTTFDPENAHDVEMQRAGWQAILDNFKNYATRNT